MPPGPNGGGLSRKAIMKRSRRYTTSSRPVRPAISARHARSQSFRPRCIPWTEGVPPVDPDQGSLRAPFRNPQPLIAAASTQRAFMPSRIQTGGFGPGGDQGGNRAPRNRARVGGQKWRAAATSVSGGETVTVRLTQDERDALDALSSKARHPAGAALTKSDAKSHCFRVKA